MNRMERIRSCITGLAGRVNFACLSSDSGRFSGPDGDRAVAKRVWKTVKEMKRIRDESTRDNTVFGDSAG